MNGLMNIEIIWVTTSSPESASPLGDFVEINFIDVRKDGLSINEEDVFSAASVVCLRLNVM